MRKDKREHERVHGGKGFGEKNELGDAILNFALAFDLVITATCFKKREGDLITYKSGNNKSQTDFFLVRQHEYMTI